MRQYKAYRPGEERYDGRLFRLIDQAQRKARQDTRINTAPPTAPDVTEQEPPRPVHPLRQMLNALREEKKREELKRTQRAMMHKAEIAAKYLNNKNG
ncbi:hypothetical protein V8I69_003900 [Salmonella enterica]